MKVLIASLVLFSLAGCASAPMNQDTLRAHAERNCRVDAAMNRTHAVTSTGVESKNIGYETCMRKAGFASR